MRILHIADVHLDRPFVGMAIEDARARRRELRSTFERCLNLAAEHHVELVTLGGDLWEDEHVTPDTLRWVSARLGALRIPVVAVAGNHDPLSPGGPYDRASFPQQVTVLPSDQGLVEYRSGDISVWGSSWRRGVPLNAAFLTDFTVPSDGRCHVLLLHGTCGMYFDGSPHCPFTAADVRHAGFDLCLAGHIHGGSVQNSLVVYPGSPEPLNWKETGRHAVALVTVETGTPDVELVDVATRRYVELDIDCDGADSSAEVQALVHAALGEGRDMAGVCLRLRLGGRVLPGCDTGREALRTEILDRGAAMVEVNDDTLVDFNLDEIAAGTGVSSYFVKGMRQLQAERPADPVVDRALRLGLRALHGEEL